MNILTIRKSLVAGIALLAMFSSMQTFAQDSQEQRTWKTNSVAGACTITDQSRSGHGGKVYNDRIYVHNPILGKDGRVYVTCPLNTSPNGLQAVSVEYYEHSQDGLWGQSVCKVVYNGIYGKYLNSTYHYMADGNSTWVFERPEYVDEYKSAYLSCRLTPYDKMFSVSTFDYH